MDEEAARKKLKAAKEAEEAKEDEKKRSASERADKRKNLETDIKNELAKWEGDLPKELEVKDEKAFVEVSGQSLYLVKRANEKEICVLAESGNRVRAVQKVAYFMDTLIASDEVLLRLKDRIPSFIEYIATKVG